MRDHLSTPDAPNFTARPWLTGSLHPDILYRIEQTLETPYLGYLRYSHPELGSTADKLNFLHSHQGEIVQTLLAKSAGFPSDTAERIRPTFYAAKTLAFETNDGLQGLATFFVDQDRQLTEAEKERLLIECGYIKAGSPKERDALLKKGVAVYSGRDVSKMKLGAETTVDLSDIGTYPGVVGPWKLPGSTIPISVLTTFKESDIKVYDLDIVDFALSREESLLIIGMEQSLRLIKEVAKKGGYERSIRRINMQMIKDLVLYSGALEEFISVHAFNDYDQKAKTDGKKTLITNGFSFTEKGQLYAAGSEARFVPVFVNRFNGKKIGMGNIPMSDMRIWQEAASYIIPRGSQWDMYLFGEDSGERNGSTRESIQRTTQTVTDFFTRLGVRCFSRITTDPGISLRGVIVDPSEKKIKVCYQAKV